MMVATYSILLILCAPILGIPTGNNITEIICEKNDDCSSNNVCVDFKCEDPCLGGCGPNTICLSGDVVPVCACKPGFAGNPFNGCYPEGHIQECTINSDCPEEQACFNGHCKDVCDDACGLNSVCKGIKHCPVCFCSPGHVWDEFFGCRIEKIKECNRDSDCTLNHTCIKDKCVSPCSGVCGQNTICCIRNHHASCACKDDYIGNPFNGCFYQNKIKLPKKYFIGGEKVGWITAMERCRSMGMNLASITSASEQVDLQRAYIDSELQDKIWVSGSHWTSKGHYVWSSTGQSFGYTNWGIGEPEDEYNCVAVDDQYTWLTESCGVKFYYACEYFNS